MTENYRNWQLHGSYFETCNCLTACPCVWLNPPSEGDCKLLVAWHIESGYWEHINLNNLNIALACYSPATMTQGNWLAALYLDERATDSQAGAMARIFSGQDGGHPKILMSFVDQVMGIKKVRIDYRKDKNKRQLVIPDIAQAEIESIQGITGGQASIENPPLCIVPGQPAIVARSSQYRYQDFGHEWNFSDRNGYYSSFDYRP